MCIQPQCAIVSYCQSANDTGYPSAGEGEASASLNAEPITTSQESHRQPRQHSFRKVNMLREADNSLEAQTRFLLYLCCIPRLRWAVRRMVFFRTRSQDWDNPVGLREREDREEGYLVLLHTRDKL